MSRRALARLHGQGTATSGGDPKPTVHPIGLPEEREETSWTFGEGSSPLLAACRAHLSESRGRECRRARAESQWMDAPVAQDVLEICGWLGSGQQVPLGSIATQFEELAHQFHRFDAFSDHVETERLG